MRIKFFTKPLVALSLLALIPMNSGAQASSIEQLKKEYERPTEIPFPDDNQYSDAKSELGKTLYFDPRLSQSGTQSCATCHNPSLGWEDGMALGIGHEHQQLGRATPTILNLAWDEMFFWDGRADTLEEQALGPIESGAEMAKDLEVMISDLKGIKEYQPMFKEAFPEQTGEVVTKDNVAKAIATYERTIVSG